MIELTLADVEAAQQRLEGKVRKTPLISALPAQKPLNSDYELLLKLENLQITGSFKARGAMSKASSLSPADLQKGLITASGGNHGLGVAYAGHAAGVPARIYLPGNTPEAKAEKLRHWGAEVIFHGDVWDDANRQALKVAAEDGLTYCHPFADRQVLAGQGTVALEVLQAAPQIDTLIIAIGGGGLISGTAFAAKQKNPQIKVIGVEPVGAPTLYESTKAGKVVELAEINTRANTLAPRRSDEMNFEIISRYVDEIVLVEDEQMQQAARWLWFEFGLSAELAGAASLAALMFGAYRPEKGARVCSIVCGAGPDGYSSAV